MNQLTYNYHHVLIIDDNKMDNLLLKEILVSLNYAEHISMFDNSVTAFNFLKKSERLPDLIFIDLSMPGISGFKFIERFSREFSHSVKFIIISASDSQADIEASAAFSNVLHYFIKPISKKDLSLIEKL